MEGDTVLLSFARLCGVFQSTPSAWRETTHSVSAASSVTISIHSLRMEGDVSSAGNNIFQKYFNPLPPHGGRRACPIYRATFCLFQSTPSAWRETLLAVRIFQHQCISIHSLRMEGDWERYATHAAVSSISIHSLRMEGDASQQIPG